MTAYYNGAGQHQQQHVLPPVDIIDATSKLQIEAAEVRNPSNKPNWSSYLRSNLVPQNEYNFIVALEEAKNKAERDEVQIFLSWTINHSPSRYPLKFE